MQGQVVCSGCRTLLLYPAGAPNVRCALCNTVTSVVASAPSGMEMAQLLCGGCRVLLMYARGAASVRCSCCRTLNLPPVSGQFAQISCGNCRTLLVYPHGAPSVKCSVCQYVTSTTLASVRVLLPPNRPNGTVGPISSSSTVKPNSYTQTVVVENPISVDEKGRLVSNVVVGVTTGKK